MMEEGCSEPLYAYLREAHNASERARDLTQQLLTFAKGGDPVRSAVVLPEVLQEVALFATRGSKVRCEFRMAEDLWLADADKGQVGQIIQNLVINAVHAMPEGGLIKLSASNEMVKLGHKSLSPGAYVCIVVSDTGSGIPAETLPHIFDPYFTTKKHGSGLGLATVFTKLAQASVFFCLP
jgi:signal transduction histidine kinase